MVLGNKDYHRISMDVVMRMLEGKGPKANTIVVQGTLYADKDLAKIVAFNKAAVTPTNPADAEQPKYSLMSDSELDGFFTTPGIEPATL